MGITASNETTIGGILRHKNLPYSDVRFLAENPGSLEEFSFEQIESLLSLLRERRKALVERIREEHRCRQSRSKDLLECTKVVKSEALRVLAEKRAMHVREQRHASHISEIDRQMNPLESYALQGNPRRKTP